MPTPDRGSASLEFIVASVVLFVPVVALTVTTSDIASASFAATAVARQGVRSFTQAENVESGLRHVHAISELVREDFGTDGEVTVDIDCSGRSCHQRGSLVSLAVTIDVPLRFIPALPGIDLDPSVRVTRSATARVSTVSVTR